MTTASALSKILDQDTADLLDENVHSKYRNRRNAKLQVRGEKEVLHHFALLAMTDMHAIDVVLHDLEVERKLLVTASSSSLGSGHMSHVPAAIKSRTDYGCIESLQTWQRITNMTLGQAKRTR